MNPILHEVYDELDYCLLCERPNYLCECILPCILCGAEDCEACKCNDQEPPF